MQLFTKRLPVELSDGSIHIIRMLPVTQLEEFRSLFDAVAAEISQERYKDINIQQAFKSEPLFKKYITELLKLVGLDFKNVPADSLHKLLFPHQCEDGSYERQGVLTKFLFGEIKGGSKASKDDVDAYAKALASLWEITKSFKEAKEILDSMPYDDLQAILEEKAELNKSPEDRAKETAKKNAMRAKEELTAKFKAGVKLELGEQVDINSLM